MSEPDLYTREPGLSLPAETLNISFILMAGKHKACCVSHGLVTQTPLKLQYDLALKAGVNPLGSGKISWHTDNHTSVLVFLRF